MSWRFRISMFLLVMTLCVSAHAQLRAMQPEELDSLQKIQPRKVLFFIGTEWCKYCALMHNTTFKNDQVIATINERYYFVNFDAETKRNIKFHNKIFKFKPTGNNIGTHQLAEELGSVEGKVSYPTICLLNEQLEFIWQTNQFIAAKDLLRVLRAIK